MLEVRAAGKEAGVGVYGTKAGMTQVFTRKGNSVPVTVISLGEGTFVTQVRETKRAPKERGGGRNPTEPRMDKAKGWER